MNRKIWVITNGAIGNLVQARGLAENMSGEKQYFTCKIADWQRLFTMRFISHRKDLLNQLPTSYLPDLVIGCGRHSIPYMLALKREYSENLKTIYVLDPRISADNFDVVVAKTMDRVQGRNVIYSQGSLHPLGRNYLTSQAEKLRNRIRLPSPPYLFIAIGGSSRTCRYWFSSHRCRKLLIKLDKIIDAYPGSVLITASRRTGGENQAMLNRHFSVKEKVYFDAEADSSTYHGMLGLATHCLISSDSINMMTEACITGVAVHYYNLPGFIHSRKQKRFINELCEGGYISTISPNLGSRRGVIVNEAPRVASLVENML